MSIAVRVENLSKAYRIRHQNAGYAKYRTLRDDIVSLAMTPLRWLKPNDTTSSSVEEFWALRDVSFELPSGGVLGIIGRNGAGKSTLLKILSRITEPTSGRIRLRGRVGSLLEVGTGFHPELTGRENIFLSGAVLGMSRTEVVRKFDQIVDFAEVERFLDTPVKRYSSGMYTRLAFAVAAHLEPEILIVDEVLAVGDAAFQNKCMKRMGAVAKEGRTVVFVSHNLGAIERLCESALLLDKGRIAGMGKPSDVIRDYLAQGSNAQLEWRRQPPYPETPHIRSVRLCHPDGSACPQPTSASDLAFDVIVSIPVLHPGLILALAIRRDVGDYLFSSSPLDAGKRLPDTSGVFRTRMHLPKAILGPKTFEATVALYDKYRSFDQIPQVLHFAVVETASLMNLLPNGRVGDLQVLCPWNEFERVEE